VATEAAVLFVKPKAISAKDKKALQGAGIIVVEVENVGDVKLVRAHAELSSSALLVAAASTINNATYSEVREKFAKAVCAAIQAQNGSAGGTANGER
jgi:hypothetical protein